MSEAADVFDGLVAPSNNQLKSIAKLGMEARRLEKMIEDMEDALSAHKREYNKILQVDLPQAMAEAGAEEFKLQDGAKIAVKSFLSGSLPKLPEARVKALNWIIKNGGSDLIKANIDIALDRGDKKLANKIRAFLKKEKVDFSDEEAIHPQTLQAWARERLEKGEATPLEDLGLYAGKVAKITASKAKKNVPAPNAPAAKGPLRSAAKGKPQASQKSQPLTTKSGKASPLAKKAPAPTKGKGRSSPGSWDERNPPPHDFNPY